MSRICFLHIGTHKTGTTSIQTFLSANEQSLKSNGIYIPRTGRLSSSSGHHNIAWELNNDPRFNPHLGTLSDLIIELRSLESPTVCISSEDFEYLYARRDSLSRLFCELSSIDCDLIPVVYLRPQAEYMESLYAELVKHGLCTDFRCFFEEIIQTGHFVFADIWRFAFDYIQLLEPLSEIFDPSHIIVRPYLFKKRTSAASLINDFLSIISNDMPMSEYRYPRNRENVSSNFEEVIRCFLTNVAKKQKQCGDAVEALHLPYGAIVQSSIVDGRFDPIHLREASRVYRRFRWCNARLRHMYGAMIPCITKEELLKDIMAAVGLDAKSVERKRLLRRYR